MSNDDLAEDDCIGIEEQGANLILELWAEVERLRAEMRKIEYLDRPQVRGLPRRVTIQQIALDALAGGKDD